MKLNDNYFALLKFECGSGRFFDSGKSVVPFVEAKKSDIDFFVCLKKRTVSGIGKNPLFFSLRGKFSNESKFEIWGQLDLEK